MRVSLMHNPKAGDGCPTKDELIRQFASAGHRTTYYSTRTKHFTRGLEDPGDVVVIAGGDGTVGKVASRLIGHNVPIAILPLGTANNIARGFGLNRTPRQIIRSLSKARAVRFDVGIARGPWGDLPFFEAAGAGLFPRMMMADHESSTPKEVTDVAREHGGFKGAIRLLQKVLATMEGLECVIRLDARELRGTYLLIEAMNMPSIGPAWNLAPDARPGDGMLDVVLVRADHRHKLERRLAAEFEREKGPQLSVHRAREIRLSCAPTRVHLDDECWPKHPEQKPESGKPRTLQIEISLFPGALRVLVPL